MKKYLKDRKRLKNKDSIILFILTNHKTKNEINKSFKLISIINIQKYSRKMDFVIIS